MPPSVSPRSLLGWSAGGWPTESADAGRSWLVWAGCAVAQLGLAAANGLVMVICCAVLLGLVFEIYQPPSQAMIADVVAPNEQVRAYGLLNVALAAAGMGAGLLAAFVGRWDLRWLFVIDALTCLLCALTVRLVLPADRRAAAVKTTDPEPVIAPWRDRVLLRMLAAGTLFAIIYLQIMITLPLALDRAGMSPSDAGLLFTTSALTIAAGQPLMRWRLLSTMSAPAAFVVGYGLLALGLAGYGFARGLPAYLAATVVWSVGDLLLVGRAYALVAGLAPPGGKGRYLAVYGTSWGIAGIAAPILGTQLLQHAGPVGLWTAMALACLLLAALQPAMVRAATRPGKAEFQPKGTDSKAAGTSVPERQ
ncbi:MFS transporter [Fodinicola feengrottensis]|uniref:MFS transporter n=1 Tax=Fodinicola feengrottensis TaxID=435914 RepID=UPI00244195A9|nr:MFS transporter [Fodinicola feengrottensis]